jgi:hypothetical protein
MRYGSYSPCGVAGLGNLTNYTGMTWVGFRPSDNECGRYNVPVNALVSIAMRKTAELCRAVYKDEALVHNRPPSATRSPAPTDWSRYLLPACRARASCCPVLKMLLTRQCLRNGWARLRRRLRNHSLLRSKKASLLVRMRAVHRHHHTISGMRCPSIFDSWDVPWTALCCFWADGTVPNPGKPGTR